MRAGAWVRPRRRVQAVADRRVHEGVPGGVELHLVHPVAVPVVAAQHRRVLVGEPGVFLGAGLAREHPDLVQAAGSPASALPVHGFEQGRVGRHVVTGERRHLVADLMGRMWTHDHTTNRG